VKFLVRQVAVRINGKILKRPNGEYFGFSNAVFNAASQPKPLQGERRSP